MQFENWIYLPGGPYGKVSAYNAGDLGSIPRLGKFPENEMATHSSIHAWKIPWMEDPFRLQSMGLQRVGHDWATFFHSIPLLWNELWSPPPFKILVSNSNPQCVFGDRAFKKAIKIKSLQIVTAAMKLKDTCSLEEKLWPT